MTHNKAFKHVGFITRKKGQSFEEFVKYWDEIHTGIALRLPGLRGYVLNPVDREKYPDSPVDGFSELWFDSLEDAVDAFKSTTGIEAYNDVHNFADHVAVTYITEIIKL